MKKTENNGAVMNYEQFKEMVVERIRDYLPAEYADAEVKVHPVKKVNMIKDNLAVYPAEETGFMVPNIYLGDAYKAYLETLNMEFILTNMADGLMHHSITGQKAVKRLTEDILNRKETIVMCLINTERYRELLNEVPHKEFLDLSIIYRMVLAHDENGLQTAMVTNELMAMMGMDPEMLERTAYENCRRDHPGKIHKLGDRLYAATNEKAYFGAAVMLFDEVLEELAERMKGSFYIMPSSIHEFMATPEKDADAQHLRFILGEVNRLYVEDNEFLSNRVYCYNAVTKTVEYAE